MPKTGQLINVRYKHMSYSKSFKQKAHEEDAKYFRWFIYVIASFVLIASGYCLYKAGEAAALEKVLGL